MATVTTNDQHYNGIADTSFTALTISAVNAPDSDLTVAIFGLEAA